MEEQIAGVPFELFAEMLPDEFAKKRALDWRERRVKGDMTVRRSYLYEDLAYDDIAELGLELGSTGNPILDAFEAEEARKVGPYSCRFPASEVEDEFKQALFQERPVNIRDASMQFAFNEVAKLIAPHSIKAITLAEARERLPRNKYSGAPHFLTVKDITSEQFERAERVLKEDPDADWIYPSIWGWRGTPGGRLPTDVKQRAIFMYDKTETVVGMRLLHAYIDALRRNEAFVAWNDLKFVDVTMTKFIDSARRKDLELISSDFSGFDNSLSAELIHLAFDILRLWTDVKEEHSLSWIERNLTHTSVLTPTGVTDRTTGGMPSGSVVTNLIDSIVNLLAALYVAHRLGTKLMKVSVLGDDAVTVYDPFPGIDEITDVLSSDLHLESSPEKNFVSKSAVHYLQRAHVSDERVGGICRGIRTITRTLNSAVNYERYRPESEDFAISRNISQFETSSNHPNFASFVERVATDNPAILKKDPVAWFSKLGGLEGLRTRLGQDSFGFTTHQGGLSTFSTVEILRSMR